MKALIVLVLLLWFRPRNFRCHKTTHKVFNGGWFIDFRLAMSPNHVLVSFWRWHLMFDIKHSLAANEPVGKAD